MLKLTGLFIIIIISIFIFKNEIIEKFQNNDSESSTPSFYAPMYYTTGY